MIPQRSDLMTDETVGSFIERRMDKRLANNIVSAVFHGIYAGDIWKLSARTLLSTPWQLEGRYGAALGGFARMQREQGPGQGTLVLENPHQIEAAMAMNEEFNIQKGFADKMAKASTFTFKQGVQQLITTLQKAVERTGNVDVKVNTPVQSTKPLEGGESGVEVATGVRPHVESAPIVVDLTKP
jgi:oxygen-dependent protoporphyrinogen oxidase